PARSRCRSWSWRKSRGMIKQRYPAVSRRIPHRRRLAPASRSYHRSRRSRSVAPRRPPASRDLGVPTDAVSAYSAEINAESCHTVLHPPLQGEGRRAQRAVVGSLSPRARSLRREPPLAPSAERLRKTPLSERRWAGLYLFSFLRQ